MRTITDRAIERCRSDIRSPSSEMQSITLDVILRTVFGLEGGSSPAPGPPPAVDRPLGRIPSGSGRDWQVDLGALSPWGRLLGSGVRSTGCSSPRSPSDEQVPPPAAPDVLSLLVAARDEKGAR